MLSLPSQVRIFAATDPVDFRKAHDGLIAIVREPSAPRYRVKARANKSTFSSGKLVHLNRAGKVS